VNRLQYFAYEISSPSVCRPLWDASSSLRSELLYIDGIVNDLTIDLLGQLCSSIQYLTSECGPCAKNVSVTTPNNPKDRHFRSENSRLYSALVSAFDADASTMLAHYTHPRRNYLNRCQWEAEREDLRGKHVLIIGGTQGIGACIPLSPSAQKFFSLL